jgi:hypothetical protein
MAKMPKYAKIQNRLLRRKTAKSVLEILGNPFILWLLSAAFLTGLGSYLTARHECLISAQSDIQTYGQLSDEIYFRRLRIFDAILATSNSIDFWRLAHQNGFAAFKQFDGQPLLALIDQRNRMNERILGIEIIGELEERQRLPFGRPFSDLLEGHDPALSIWKITDDEIHTFKRSALRDYLLMYDETHSNLKLGSLEPHCGFGTLLSDSLMVYQEHNIEFVPQPALQQKLQSKARGTLP